MDVDVQVGKVTHYYDKIGVAVVEVVNKKLKVGDTVRFSGHDKEFKQKISSLQAEHEKIKKADIGQAVGVKVNKPVKAGDVLYLTSG